MLTRTRTAVIIAAAVAFATSTGTSVAGASPAAATTPASASSAPRQVTLPTGDVVSVSTSPDGRQEASVLRENPGAGGQFQMFSLGGDLYVVPQSAVPYLGSTMDLALFDVTNPPSTVQVTYRSAASPSAVPGLRITQRSGTSGQGIAQGHAFGAALAAQATRDHAAPTHTTGLFANVARIGTPSSSVVTPNFVMQTLTINGVDQTGAADTGDDVLVYNVDDLRKYAGDAIWRNGVAKVSVPNGHYAALGVYYDFVTGTVRMVSMPQFTVNADTSITLDARAATSAVSVTTAQPATPSINEVGFGRTDKTGATASYAFLGGGTTSFLVQPTTKRVTIGQLHYYVYTRAFGPDYSYDLEFPSDGAISANQSYVVRDSDLAAIDSKYPASHPNGQSLDTRFGALPWQLFLFAADLTFATPTERTEYYSAIPSINWQGLDYQVFSDNPFALLGALQSAWRTYTPGTSYSTTWGGTPNPPRLLEGAIYVGETVCPACVSGSRLDLLGYPFSDNSPEHFGFPDGSAPGLTESVSDGVYADDVLVKQGTFLDTEVTMPSGTQTYRIDYNTTRSSTDFALSTDVQTRWTVPASVATGALPAGWVCTYRANPPAGCGVLPLITSSYDLPVDLLGQLPAGATTATLDLGHLGGSPLAFTSVKVKASFNGGQTWRAVTVTDQGGGHYGLAFTSPAGAGFGALQVTVRDSVGGTFTQTVQHAFAIGS